MEINKYQRARNEAIEKFVLENKIADDDDVTRDAFDEGYDAANERWMVSPEVKNMMKEAKKFMKAVHEFRRFVEGGPWI